ncbi:BamA/TamA family outer membrane protein [Ferruginibacter profundus]
MMPLKKLYLLLFILSVVLGVTAQNDSIRSRIIFIGDAGEKNPHQEKLIQDAAERIIAGKTTVMYLGDNIYPRGMGLPGSKDEASTQQILQSQFAPMRSKGAAVYFTPGNHDWDRMGVRGLEKIIAQNNFIKSRHDPLLQMAPANGCPGPTEINIGDSIAIIAFDSEWWLFQHNKKNAAADCDCDTKKEFTDKLFELLYKNRYKVILLADHHPFQTYGHHGGYFSFIDHLFPLTAINKNLYVPLPVIGSLYPLLRSTLVSPEDKKHPLYKDMIKQVDDVFEHFPNLVHVAGHEHGLQFIKSDQIQIVSGAGAKNTFVKAGKHALFAKKNSGYVVADLLIDNQLRFTYYLMETPGNIVAGFTYLQPYTNIKRMEDSLYKAVATNNEDSILVQANAAYDKVSKLHRKIFGENYRKEWSAKTKLPVIKLSEIKGGLTPVQRGGGHQSLSLRLQDSTGKEWVLRSVNKYPEVLLPEALRETFAKDIITDAMSAQHPYSALVVPVFADAVGVPHSNPIIGLVAADKKLGIYQNDFMNTVCLLEEREPLGKSDNSPKMYKELLKDNDNSLDSTLLLKAKLLDLLLGDWDRHEDQWRWAYEKEGKGKKYIPVPRDRDQVFHIMDGVLPSFINRPWVLPLLHDFDGKIKQVNAFFAESDTMSRRLLNQFSYEQWMAITNAFTASITNDVIEKAITKLPQQNAPNSTAKIVSQLKERRNNIPAAMSKYYHFINKIVDIQTSDKNELVSITDAPGNGLEIVINKINKEGKIKEQLYKRVFYPSITKEIRLYVQDGNDSVIVNNHSNIRLRLVGAGGEKKYTIVNAKRKLHIYGNEDNVSIANTTAKIKEHLSNDNSNTAYIPTNSYNKIIPMLNVGYNLDDGPMLGAAVKFINQGFRKKPYASMQQLSFTHSFSTAAYKINFHSEWLNAISKNDILLDTKILAPDNTQNFFGFGNNTIYNKDAQSIKYFRARFSIYQADIVLRKRYNKNNTLSIGPSFQYYHFDLDDNKGRFISNTSLIGSYDSTTISNDKAFAGVVIKFVKDNRSNKIIPVRGSYLSVNTQAYAGINNYSKNFAQVIPEFAFYKKLSNKENIVFANRLGGGITLGKTAFYQSQFLGGHENLYGYRQYRFAGNYMLYNNAELRIKIAQAGSYILPGQLGLIGFYDAGKVWANGSNSKKIHQGVGGGIYFAPAQIAVLQLILGHSTEGWYPYFSLGFRF